jgi:hypothetical protein
MNMKIHFWVEAVYEKTKYWNDGMMEYWNVGFGRMGEWGMGEMGKMLFFLLKVLTVNCMKCYYSIIPPFHYSIIPGWIKQNAGVEILYYLQFIEFPIHKINKRR